MTQPHPTLEPLESRLCLAIIAAAITSGALTLKGDSTPSNAVITQTTGQIQVRDWSNGFSLLVAADGIRSVLWAGGSSADKLDAHGLRVPLVAYAGPGNDVVVGGSGNDKLFGGAGSDKVYGMGGNDWLEPGSRWETAGGGTGQDWQAEAWVTAGTRPADVAQGSAPDCSWLAALAAVSRTRDLEDRIRYLGGFLYSVALWDGYWRNVTVRFDGRLSRYDPVPTMEGESWVVLHARAFRALRKGNIVVYPSQALLNLTGRMPDSAGYWGRVPMSYSWVVSQLAQGRGIVGATWDVPSDRRLTGRHAYAIIDISNGWVCCYNPWGFQVWVPWRVVSRDFWGLWSG